MSSHSSADNTEAPTVPQLTSLSLHKKSRLLTLIFNDNECYDLSCEYLRVYSPSAEQRGHGSQPGKLATNKANVSITAIQRVGHYAVQFVFDDGHQTGLYTWPYLYTLCQQQTSYWNNYLDRLKAAQASRDKDTQVLNLPNE